MANLTNKPTDISHSLTQGKLRTQQSSFKQRLAQHQADTIDPQTMPNRICLLLDCSGSMSELEGERRLHEIRKPRIDLLKEAVQNFVSRCNFRDTSVAISTFPSVESKALHLTTQSTLAIAFSMGLEANGSTPLHECLVKSLESVAMTRGVIVSDGGATDWDRFSYSPDEDQESVEKKADTILHTYKEQDIPLDCVHISSSTDGEELLRRIASTTGGVFMKFTDVTAFSKAFGFLTPGYRAMLTSGEVSATQIGAKEIK